MGGGGGFVKKIIILIGNYCSGKTEIALNLAVRAAERGLKTQVVDLDRINDYFRMSDHIRVLGQRGVDLVSPSFVGCGLTQTVMPARVASAFDGDWDLVVFDVGGDQAGALSLARYHQDFAALEPGQLEVWDIVNVFRPMSESPDKVIKLMGELEGFARQKVTGLVNNSNLLNYSSPDDLRRGWEVLREVSERTGIPVVLTTGRRPFLEEFLRDGRDARFTGEAMPLEPTCSAAPTTSPTAKSEKCGEPAGSPLFSVPRRFC